MSIQVEVRKQVLTEDDLRAGLEQALLAAGIEATEILMGRDPFGGWRVVVVERTPSAGAPMPPAWLPPDLDREIALLSFRSEEDREDVDALLAVEVAQQPLWPEALARGSTAAPSAPRFAADLNIALPPPIVTTFYSLRGGVGRSTALAYVARILARDNRVLCVDMDLEAPGLAALFDVENEVDADQGVVPLLVQLDLGGRPELADHLIRIEASSDLYLLPAGLPSAEYARRLAQIDPVGYYQEDINPLRELMSIISSSRLHFDVILLDSRTGISPLSAPLLFDLADLAVVSFFPHPQAFRGTHELVRALLRAKTQRKEQGAALTPSPHFLISPVPSTDRETVERYEERALDQLEGWLAETGGDSFNAGRLAEITTFITYNDLVAASDDVLGPEEMTRPYEPLAEWIAGYLPGTEPAIFPAPVDDGATGAEGAGPGASITRALDELPFDASVAERQEIGDLVSSFVRTRGTDLALRPETALVIGRKGTGKTAIFRRLRESADDNLVVLAPAGLSDPWLPGPNEFESIDEHRRAVGLEWRVIWQLLTALVAARHDPAVPVPAQLGPLALPADRGPAPPTNVVYELRRLMAITDIGLLSQEWLLALDAAAAGRRLLLFDGLDTGFGSSAASIDRRTAAVAGLLELAGEFGGRLVNLTFKVLLREDIYKAVNVQNKSHFYGRQADLSWSDSTEYLNVAVKRAMRSESFRELLARTVDDDARGLLDISVDQWPSHVSQRAWRLLVGDRMAGSKTAFTANWVWRRLADGNDDHTPRSLLQLLMSARDREQALRQHTDYARSVIRARTLMDSLGEVSTQALIALREEYAELEPVFEALRRIGQTPFDAEHLETAPDLLALAQEVGLLTAVLSPSGRPERFKVPELYRLELQMGRKGQR